MTTAADAALSQGDDVICTHLPFLSFFLSRLHPIRLLHTLAHSLHNNV